MQELLFLGMLSLKEGNAFLVFPCVVTIVLLLVHGCLLLDATSGNRNNKRNKIHKRGEST
jgi:hypothetical protein